MLIVINASHLVSHMRLWIFMNPKSLYVNNAVDPLTFPTVKFPEYKWMRYHKICNTYSSLQLSVCFLILTFYLKPLLCLQPHKAHQTLSRTVYSAIHLTWICTICYTFWKCSHAVDIKHVEHAHMTSHCASVHQSFTWCYYLQVKNWEVMRKTALNDSTLIFNQDGELDKLTNITMKIFYLIIQRSFWWVQSCDWSIITWEIKTEMRAEAYLKRFACVTEALYFYSVPS